MGRYHAILFDMDGTLLDTLTDMQDAVNHVLAAHGLPLRTLEEVRCFVGNGAGPLIHRALPEGYPQEQKVLAEYRAYYQAHNCVQTCPYPGIPELLERLEVGLLVLPDVEEDDPLRREITALAEEKGIETLFLAEDGDVTFGESALRIYAPLGSGGANEEGLSVLCTAGDFDGLITGDMNDTVEKRLIKYGSLPDLELLVAGHHGSKYATSEELLLATTPELAVISVGYNTYGHPAPETLERLAAAGCAIYRTDWSGTVTITAK